MNTTFDKSKNSNRPEFFIKHKDYFDEKLINVLVATQNKCDRLTEEINKLRERIVIKDDIISYLKIREDSIKKKYQLDLKEKNDEINDCIKDLQDLIDDMKKTIDRISEDNKNLTELIIEKDKIINDLEIEKRKKKNSSNSSLPPSMDFGSIKANINSREKSDKKLGGQKGHKAHLINLNNKPTKIIIKKVKKAPIGATPYKDENGNILYYSVQEIDYKLKELITETRYIIDDAGEELSEKELLKHKISPVIYGPKIKTLLLMLSVKGTIPLQRLSEIINEIFDNKINISQGTICNWLEELRNKSKPILNKIANNVMNQPIIHVDETSSSLNGNLIWIHAMTNKEGTIYYPVEKRGDKDGGALKVLSNYEGYLVHDHFLPYYKYEDKAYHVECNAHVLRALQYGIENDNSVACILLKDLFLTMLETKKDYLNQNKGELEKEKIEEFEKKYDKIINDELIRYETLYPNRIKGKYCPEYISLFRRLAKFKDNHLIFIKDFNVPFDNNAAERACRKVKNKKKVSTQFKTMKYAEIYFDILSLFETLRMKKKNIRSSIENILSR